MYIYIYIFSCCENLIKQLICCFVSSIEVVFPRSWLVSWVLRIALTKIGSVPYSGTLSSAFHKSQKALTFIFSRVLDNFSMDLVANHVGNLYQKCTLPSFWAPDIGEFLSRMMEIANSHNKINELNGWRRILWKAIAPVLWELYRSASCKDPQFDQHPQGLDAVDARCRGPGGRWWETKMDFQMCCKGCWHDIVHYQDESFACLFSLKPLLLRILQHV